MSSRAASQKESGQLSADEILSSGAHSHFGVY